MVAYLAAINAGLSMIFLQEKVVMDIYWYRTRYCQLVLCVVDFVSVKRICLEVLLLLYLEL